VTTVVDRLESRGLVRRTRDDADRRSVLVEPTAAAWRKADEVYTPLAENGQRALGRYSVEELGALLEMIRTSRTLTDERVQQVRAKAPPA
jgi:DNA-binding MarR family transcriptional regulator